MNQEIMDQGAVLRKTSIFFVDALMKRFFSEAVLRETLGDVTALVRLM